MIGFAGGLRTFGLILRAVGTRGFVAYAIRARRRRRRNTAAATPITMSSGTTGTSGALAARLVTSALYAGVASTIVGMLPDPGPTASGAPLSSAVKLVTDSRTLPPPGKPTRLGATVIAMSLRVLLHGTLVPPL